MKLEKWALIGDLVGGIAIVISLVVLIVEVRSNTDAIHDSNRQSIAMRAQELALILLENPDINDGVSAAIEGRDIPEEVFGEVVSFASAGLRVAEEAFLLREEGKLDERYWEQRANVTLSLYRNESLRANFREYRARAFYIEEFSDWFNAAMIERYGD